MVTVSRKENAQLSVAPMMDWTDRHCRYFHRLMSKNTLLYTEMVTAAAVLHGDRDRLLRYDETEHPVALQLGGSEPDALAMAAEIGASFGYDEINLNVGCPSDRVQSGAFGAVLMKSPALVRDCVAAMQNAVPAVPVTVKCRIGVDDQTPAEVLPNFISTVAESGIQSFTIHARMAWLEGLSPKENRDIPPLDYDLVIKMREQFPNLKIGINGGITDLTAANAFLQAGLDHVMIGRAAYHDPASILLPADVEIFGGDTQVSDVDVVQAMLPYIEAERRAGTRLNAITRHMLGLFLGRPGARRWRRYLSEHAHLDGAGPEVVEAALAHVTALAA